MRRESLFFCPAASIIWGCCDKMFSQASAHAVRLLYHIFKPYWACMPLSAAQNGFSRFAMVIIIHKKVLQHKTLRRWRMAYFVCHLWILYHNMDEKLRRFPEYL